jgi:ketosteroid isomerase-like protein
VDKDKKNPRPSDSPVHSAEMDELYRRLQPEMRRPKPSPEALTAALEAAQRLAAETDAEQAADDTADDLSGESMKVCQVCGYRNREGNKFCGMCGITVGAEGGSSGFAAEPEHEQSLPLPANLTFDPEPARGLDHDPSTRLATTRPSGQETHHYHHHYHHHYFPGGEAMGGARSADPVRADSGRESTRDPRPTAALRGDLSRAEAAVRRIAQEWVLACNTKHLDDLIELYTTDAIVLRSNCPPIRGAAAVREFFFGALDAGLGEVEVEPLRVEVVGDLAYEAGRCKALIPSATGKRREERGKYLWVCARQSNGEWKLTADCWSSDLTLSNLESDVPQSAGVKTALPRKIP